MKNNFKSAVLGVRFGVGQVDDCVLENTFQHNSKERRAEGKETEKKGSKPKVGYVLHCSKFPEKKRQEG